VGLVGYGYGKYVVLGYFFCGRLSKIVLLSGEVQSGKLIAEREKNRRELLSYVPTVREHESEGWDDSDYGLLYYLLRSLAFLLAGK